MLIAQLGLLLGVPASVALAFAYRRFRKTSTDEIESFARYVGYGIKFYVGRRVRRRLAAELMLRQYARLHLRSTAVDMSVPARLPLKLKVDEVFVPLLLQDAGRDQLEHSKITSEESARYVIIGDPGSGKTSLMKRLFRDACRKASSRPRDAQLPIFFELRRIGELDAAELEEIDGAKLFDLCVSDLIESAVFETKSGLEQLQSGSGYLLLLDGLDEVPSHASNGVIRAISELSTSLSLRSPQSSMIVSTRAQHYLALHDREFKEQFGALAVKPFSTADIYQFLLNWRLWNGPRRDEISRVFSRIRSLPSLHEMCTNPLALAMFVARDRETQGELSPETRTEFYSLLVDEFLVNRRARNDADPMGRQRLKKNRENVLGAICLGHLLDSEEPGNSVPTPRLVGEIRRSGVPEESIHDVLTELSVDTGLFGPERDGETYRFLHLTLCEFLAAREIVHAGSEGWDLVVAKLSEKDGSASQMWISRLRETISFAAGLAPRAQQQEIVRSVLAISEPSLSMRVAIECQDYEGPEMSEEIQTELADLATVPSDRWTTEWFARLRLVLAVLRDYHAGLQNHRLADAVLPSAADFLTSLIDEQGTEELLLATLARDDPAAAVAIAESSNEIELMNIVASAADDFSVLTAILARCDAGSYSWKSALVNRALRQRDLAEVLATTTDKSREEMQALGRWSRSVLVGGSSYGRLLDDVIDQRSEWQKSDLLLLDSIALLKPNRFVFATAVRSDFPSAAIILSFPVVVAAMSLYGANGSNSVNTIVTLVALVFALAGMMTLLRRLLEMSARRTKAFAISGSTVVEATETVASPYLQQALEFLTPLIVPDRSNKPRQNSGGTTKFSFHREILNLGDSGVDRDAKIRHSRIIAGTSDVDVVALRVARGTRKKGPRIHRVSRRPKSAF